MTNSLLPMGDWSVVAEQKFLTGNKNLVVYFEKKEQGVKEKNEH